MVEEEEDPKFRLGKSCCIDSFTQLQNKFTTQVKD